MDTPIENLIVIYYELIYEANKVITDTPEPGNIEDYKKQTSFILRRIIHNCYRRLYTQLINTISHKKTRILYLTVSRHFL